MSKHQDYVFRERSQYFDHAVGFAGKVDNLSSKEKAKTKDDKGAYYYYGSSKSQDEENRWINAIPILAFLALLTFGFGLFWGLLSLAFFVIYIFVVLLVLNKNKK